MKKKERYDSISALIRSSRVSNQGDIASELRKQGFKVTQASISRDLRAMGVIKSDGYYKLPNGHDDDFQIGRIHFYTAGESLIVGRCTSGLASAFTVRIDAEHVDGIVGTIAGDDTVFIAVKNLASQLSVLTRLGQMFDRGQ